MRRRLALPLLLLCSLLTAGCEQLGIETPAVAAARKQADSKAIGGGCRHAGRAIEDCYALNKKADKASVFAGWREMNEYMQENKLEAVPPTFAVAAAAASAPAGPGETDDAEPAGESRRARAAKPGH